MVTCTSILDARRSVAAATRSRSSVLFPVVLFPIVLLLMGWLSTVPLRAEEPRSFDHEVMAVLSRAGCNLGTCHGNLNGKGAFFLSLRGQDPVHDYLAMTHDHAGRRVNRAAPSESLLLLKPTAAVPHQGGQRFGTDSLEYRILHDWLADGAPGPDTQVAKLERIEVSPMRAIIESREESPVALRVLAFFQDGITREVTQLATFEATNFVARVDEQARVHRLTEGETTILVRYLDQQVAVQLVFLPSVDEFPAAATAAPPPLAPSHNRIDQWIQSKLAELHLTPRPLCPDHVFLRRVYLDLTGRLPSAEEARAFLFDSRHNKRPQLIDTLLSRPEFAEQWALRWGDLLRNEEKLLDPQGVARFHDWMRDAFASAMPLDQFAQQIIAAQGSTYEHPPTNFYRALRDPLSRGEATARVFYGVRLECAKCHNHPFDRWSQDDYYDWATVFGRIDYEIVANERKDKFDQNEFVGEQRVIWKSEGEVINARTGQAARPRFLGEVVARLDQAPQPPRLEQLAHWMTQRGVRPFALAQANRIWFHHMGRGLVEPLDDFRVTNPASHPELLELLADELISHQFDLRALVRMILQSAAYQADWLDGSEIDSPRAILARDNYAGVTPRRLTAEQLLDAQCQVLDIPPRFNGYDRGVRANQLAGVQRVRPREERPSDDDRFLSVFGKPQRLLSCECERTDSTTLTQAFYLLSGSALQKRIASKESRLARWTQSSDKIETWIDELYWTALSRPASPQERAICVEAIHQQKEPLTGLQDVAWALLSTKEFLFRP